MNPVNINERMKALGILLPPVPAPVANFDVFSRVGNLLFLSGQGPLEASGILHTGKVGEEVSVEEAYEDAKLTTLNLLAAAQLAVGDLSHIRRVVKLLGWVNAAPTFTAHPKVMNGCSDLLVHIFGEAIGRSARSAIGAASLPSNQTVEIEAIMEVF